MTVQQDAQSQLELKTEDIKILALRNTKILMEKMLDDCKEKPRAILKRIDLHVPELRNTAIKNHIPIATSVIVKMMKKCQTASDKS